MAKETKIKLCEHLAVGKPTTVNGSPARLRCGQCFKEWVWNEKEKAYVCVVDPEKDGNINAVGKLFR